MILHLAAQPLVRLSYQLPLETLQVNVLGTAHLLEAVRAAGRPCAVVVVTSDKCYENQRARPRLPRGRAHGRPRRLLDVEGGGRAGDGLLAPLLLPPRQARPATAWRWPPPAPATSSAAATGPVTGSSPTPSPRWPRGRPIPVRNPHGVRPWQHVLEPLGGYLLLGARLLGPQAASLRRGLQLRAAPRGRPAGARRGRGPHRRPGARGAGKTSTTRTRRHEAGLLRLSIDKATARLGWAPRWHFDETFRADRGVVPGLPRRAPRPPSPRRALPHPDQRVPGVLTPGQWITRPKSGASPPRSWSGPARSRGSASRPRRRRRSSPASRRSVTPAASTARRSWPTSAESAMEFWLTGGRWHTRLESRPGRVVRRLPRPPRQLRLVGQPAGGGHAHLAPARRPAAPAGRRGDHRGRRLPHHRGAGDPARPGAGLRRRHAPRLQHRRLEARGGPLAAHPGGDGGPHARQPLRSRRGERLLQAPRPLAGRGQLRRRRLRSSRGARPAPSATSPRSASTRRTT